MHVPEQQHLGAALRPVVAVYGAVGTEVLVVLLGARPVELRAALWGVFTRELHQLAHLLGGREGESGVSLPWERETVIIISVSLSEGESWVIV